MLFLHVHMFSFNFITVINNQLDFLLRVFMGCVLGFYVFLLLLF